MSSWVFTGGSEGRSLRRFGASSVQAASVALAVAGCFGTASEAGTVAEALQDCDGKTENKGQSGGGASRLFAEAVCFLRVCVAAAVSVESEGCSSSAAAVAIDVLFRFAVVSAAASLLSLSCRSRCILARSCWTFSLTSGFARALRERKPKASFKALKRESMAWRSSGHWEAK